MRVESHLPASELVRLERCEKSAERARRLRIVMLTTNDWTAPAVAMATDSSQIRSRRHRTVQTGLARDAAIDRRTTSRQTVASCGSPRKTDAEGLISPRLNTEIINLFLAQFSRTLPPDEHAVMIWDGAGFHRSHALSVPANITLVQLPACSPELNPIENLWHCLNSHHWSNRAYDNYDALAYVTERLNNRPRKRLNYLTPLEALNKAGFALQM